MIRGLRSRSRARTISAFPAMMKASSAELPHKERPMSVTPVNTQRSRFAGALGEAVLECWADLPQEIQHLIFEKAVVCGHHDQRDESLREQLAEYLHDHHPRTDR